MQDVDDHCFYHTHSGHHLPSYSRWEGMQTARKQGDRIGMLLDLYQGSMSIYKDDERLGVMVSEGLTGPLCWAVTIQRTRTAGDSARIESAPVPADE